MVKATWWIWLFKICQHNAKPYLVGPPTSQLLLLVYLIVYLIEIRALNMSPYDLNMMASALGIILYTDESCLTHVACPILVVGHLLLTPRP